MMMTRRGGSVVLPEEPQELPDPGCIGDGEEIIPGFDDRVAPGDDEFLLPHHGGDQDLDPGGHRPQIGELLSHDGGIPVDVESEQPDPPSGEAEDLRCPGELQEVHHRC